MNYTKKPKSLLAQIKNNLEDAVSFTIEFYKQKPHWDTEYYDVFSGCKESFEVYRNKFLTEKFTVKASFELKDFENAIFRFAYKTYKINPTEIAYIKIIDDANIFQGKSWYNTYFFVINVSFTSTEIAIFQAQLDFWMTYWEKFSFNGKMIKCLRKHMPRYRTDEGHIGEYDFSTNSCVLNIDQIEGQYTNLVSTERWYLSISMKGREKNLDAIQITNFNKNDHLWVYCIVIPKSSDSVMRGIVPKEKWIKVDDIIKNGNDPYALNLLYVDCQDYNSDRPKASLIRGCPWFIFSLANETRSHLVGVKLKDTSFYPQERKTYITYNYRETCYLGERISAVFYVDHPIFYFFQNYETNQDLYVNNLVYIDSLSEKNKGDLPANVQEISCYTFNNFDNIGWPYVPYVTDQPFIKPYYYKPLKDYLETDKISLDQEPALFRNPHFEFEYSIYSVKGILKIYNELLLNEGHFNDYGTLWCDYIIHGDTILKYLYVKNGWYKAQYEMWKIGLFEENSYSFDLISDKYQDFLLNQKSQFNNSYNQSLANSFLGIAEGVGGILAAPFTGGLSAGIGIGAGLSFINNAKNAAFTAMSRQAQIQDLQRTPSTRTNASNNFSNTSINQIKNTADSMNSVSKGTLVIRQHRENEQWILYIHFHRNGYLVHKLLEVPSLSWFYSRHWFDYFQIEDFSTVLDNTKYSQYILNKFNNIFHRGIRLWHTTDHFLDYSLNNKEIDGWKEIYLKK